MKTTTALKINLADEAECKKFFVEGTGAYANLGLMAIAKQIVAKESTLTTDDITFDKHVCTAQGGKGELELEITVFIKKGNTKGDVAVKKVIDDLTATEWKTLVQAACDSVTQITPKATVEDATARMVLGAVTETNGKYGKLAVTLKVKTKTASECDELLKADAGGQQALDDLLVTAANSKIEATQVTFPGIASTCTSGEGKIPFAVTMGRLSKVNLDDAKTAIDAYVMGSAKGDANSWWKALDGLTDVTNDLANAPSYDPAAAITLQTADQFVSGSTDLTLTDYAECSKLKEPEVILVLKKKIMAVTNALYSEQALTFSCKAAVATMALEITSKTGEGGNTLADDVKKALEGVADWGATVKAEADKVLGTALAKCTGGTSVTWSAPAAVPTKQAKAAVITGSVVYEVKNRADCEDIVGKKSNILTALQTAAGAQTTATDGNMISVACLDKVPTMTYTIVVKKDATTIDTVIVNKLNGMLDDDWKKIITDGLKDGTAVSLEDETKLKVKTINGAASAELTTTTTTTYTGTTTAAPYTAMSKVMGQYTTEASESDCLNMKDQASKIADLIKTKSGVTDAKATVTATVKCAAKTGGNTWVATIDFTIMMPTSSTPTGEKVVTDLKKVTAATWQTDAAAAVGGVTDVPAPTLTAWATATEPAATAVTTTKGPTTTFTGSTTLGTKKEVKGSLKVQVASEAECKSMADTKGIAGLKTMLKDITSIATENIAIAVTCTAVRRLSDGRRLTAAYNANVAYTLTVPANSAVTADAAKTSLSAVSNSDWKTKVQGAMTTAGVTVTVASVAATAPTVTTIHSVSSAMMLLASPMVGVMVLLHFLL